MQKNIRFLKVMTYNIHSGRSIYLFPQFHRLIQFLQKERPDIIGIQEINENGKRGYQFSKMKALLKMNGHFAPLVKLGNGYYGISTFTPFEIIEKYLVPLPSKKEQRGMLHTVIRINGKKMHLLNTHLGLNHKERIKQFQKIENYLNLLKGEPCILMGDFNTSEPVFKSIHLIDSAKIMNQENEETLMHSKKRIDFLFVSPDLKVTSYKVLRVNMSDHYPIVIKIIL